MGLGLALALAAFGAFTLRRAGAFRQIEPMPLKGCAEVRGVPGPEDITFHPTGGWAWVSSFDRRAWTERREPVGAIYRYHPEDGRLVDATPSQPEVLHPHGLDLWVGPQGQQVLYVVNHAALDDRRVEIYDVVGWELRHRRTVSGLQGPNDVAAVDGERFYVTQDHRFSGGLPRVLEEVLAAPVASLHYWDSAELSLALSGLAYPNGVQVSQDGRTVWLTETTGRRLRVLHRDPTTGALTEETRVDLGTAPDNIEVGPQGDLWIAAHPKMLAFLAHADDAASPSPSEVLRVRLDGEEPVVESVAMDDGSGLSAASVAAVSDERLLLGAVFEPHFLVCDVP